nr:hypothetical protein [Desulfobacula sp.]
MKELCLSPDNLSGLLDILLGEKHAQRVKIPCKGFSMSPFISDSDTIVIEPLNTIRNLRIGDIVVVLLSKQKIIIHRIIRIKDGSLLLKGDNLADCDGWFKKREVMGIVEAVFKKKFNYRCNPFINYIIAIGSRTKIFNRFLVCIKKLKTKYV